MLTAQRQAAFLANLQLFGNVRGACLAARVSAQTAYRARARSAGFRLAWDAALLAARGHAEATLADRAIHGVEEAVYYHGEEVARRRRFDSRLLLAHLARLDRLEARAEVAAVLGVLDDCIEALEEGADIDALLPGGAAENLPQGGVPPVPSCRNEEGEPEEGGPEEGEPELERRLQAMEAARPADAPGIYEQAAAAAGRAAGPWEIEAAQLEAFEAGDPRWWERVPAADEAANPASATQSTGVSDTNPRPVERAGQRETECDEREQMGTCDAGSRRAGGGAGTRHGEAGGRITVW